jgi:hypothetical protein
VTNFDWHRWLELLIQEQEQEQEQEKVQVHPKRLVLWMIEAQLIVPSP